MALHLETTVVRAVAHALAEPGRQAELRAIVRGGVDAELHRIVGTLVDDELAARQNGEVVPFDSPAEASDAPEPPSTRRCLRCHETKPMTDFARDRTSPDGFRRECRTCKSARERERKQARRAQAAADEEPHPATPRTGVQLRRGGPLLGPMELAAAEQRREAIEAARHNGVEHVEREGRTFTLLHLPAELDPGRRRDAPAPVRARSWQAHAVA